MTGGEQLRESMRRWATGVAVVTSCYLENEHGMTVNSFTSVALNPPLVMVALDRVTRTSAMVSQSGIFGVTVLASGQQYISERFAGRDEENENRFRGIPTWRLVSGAPFICGGLAFLDCRVIETHPVATHALFIGELTSFSISPRMPAEPLLYFNRGYARVEV